MVEINSGAPLELDWSALPKTQETYAGPSTETNVQVPTYPNAIQWHENAVTVETASAAMLSRTGCPVTPLEETCVINVMHASSNH